MNATQRAQDAIPEYGYRQAPDGLLTRAQLDAKGLSPGPARARLVWSSRRTSGQADLFRLDEAKPKRAVSEAQRQVLQRGRQVQADARRAERQAQQEEDEADDREAEAEHEAKVARDHAAAVREAKELLALGEGAALLDFETHDLDGALAVEIGVLALDGRVLFHSLVDPQVPIAQGARDKHGITDEELAGAPAFGALWPLFEILRDKVIIAYGSGFDRGVFFHELHRLLPEARRAAGVEQVAPFLREDRWRCGLDLYARFVGEWSAFHVYYRYQKLPGGGHRSLADCRALLSLLHHIAGGDP